MIPIRDFSGRIVGKVVVTGGYEGDQMSFVLDKRLSKDDHENIKSRFDDAVMRGSEWAGQSFFGPGGVEILGWSNFYGIAEALDKSLPGNGLRVEWNDIDWPDDTPHGGGDLIVPKES